MWDTASYRQNCRNMKLGQLIKEQKRLKDREGSFICFISKEKLSIINRIIEEKFNEKVIV